MTKIKKILDTEEMQYSTDLKTSKDVEKYIKRIERIVRASQEYKDYISFLKDNIDMTKCAFFNNIDSKDNRKVKIEIHHEPLTLFYITQTVLNKHIAESIPLNDLYIADEIMELHYNNMVGLIPLSKTVHKTVHNSNELIIPLYMVYGNYQQFVKDYENYIDDNVIDLLERKIEETRTVKEESFSKLDKQFIYIEVDGFNLPSKIDQKGNETA